MDKLYLGKINLKKIDKNRIFDGKDGNKWIDITIWVSEPDQFGNELSIQQSTKRDEAKIFLGNAKEYIRKEDKNTSEPGGFEEW